MRSINRRQTTKKNYQKHEQREQNGGFTCESEADYKLVEWDGRRVVLCGSLPPDAGVRNN
ncbi:MAG: hypothetical protein LBH70_01685 [Spirochaetaceae bacterium]|nr:hypothetical protein [Spirochaetaceae bacterium]